MKYLLIIAVLFATCGGIKIERNDKKPTDMKEIVQRSGIEFDGGEVLFEEDNLGGHQEAQSWLIRSAREISLPKGEGGYLTGDDAANYLADFQRLSPQTSFGKPNSDKRTTSLWENENGGWQGNYIMTETGCYLSLEWVKQN